MFTPNLPIALPSLSAVPRGEQQEAEEAEDQQAQHDNLLHNNDPLAVGDLMLQIRRQVRNLHFFISSATSNILALFIFLTLCVGLLVIVSELLTPNTSSLQFLIFNTVVCLGCATGFYLVFFHRIHQQVCHGFPWWGSKSTASENTSPSSSTQTSNDDNMRRYRHSSGKEKNEEKGHQKETNKLNHDEQRELSTSSSSALMTSTPAFVSPGRHHYMLNVPLLRDTISQAAKVLHDVNVRNTYWQMPPFLGTNFVSAYYLIRQFLIATDDAAERNNPHHPMRVWPRETNLKTSILRRHILSTQLKDGSWQNVPNPNVRFGEMDSTIFNYWALKVMAIQGDFIEDDDCRDKKFEEDKKEQQGEKTIQKDNNSMGGRGNDNGGEKNSKRSFSSRRQHEIDLVEIQVLSAMEAAKSWILQHGGADSANYMSKLWMALFGAYDYAHLYEVPMFAFAYGRRYDVEDMVAQWVYPHLIPMAYIRAMQVRYPGGGSWPTNTKACEEGSPSSGSNFSVAHSVGIGSTPDGYKWRLDELFPPEHMPNANRRIAWSYVQSFLIHVLDRSFGHNRSHLSKESLAPAINRMLENQCETGSFGAYTVSTLFTAVALQHYVQNFRFSEPSDFSLPAFVQASLMKSHHFVEKLYFPQQESDEKGGVLHCSAEYRGVLDDGRYWDTILSGIAACESFHVRTSSSFSIENDPRSHNKERPGEEKKKRMQILGAVQHLLDQQAKTGASHERTAPAGIMSFGGVTPSDGYRRAISNIGPKGMGGIPYGEDFWYAPDIDDTAETATLFSLALQKVLKEQEEGSEKEKVEKKGGQNVDFMQRENEEKKKSIEQGLVKALDWLVFMQSKNGGFGAFHRNREGNKLIYLAVKQFECAASLFDPQCADITGHVLEAYGLAGYGYTPQGAMQHRYSDTVRRAVGYLQNTQEKDGSWWARWGINYLYGTSAALVGLARVGLGDGFPMHTGHCQMVQKALDFLASTQAEDGGWGEAPQSYDNSWFRYSAFHGKGVSTPTHTAWAILGLLEAFTSFKRGLTGVLLKKYEASIFRGVDFLLKSFHKDDLDKKYIMMQEEEEEGGRRRVISWLDNACVGTGHPGVLYMQYPSYAYCFPLMALSRVLEHFCPTPKEV